MCYCCRKLVKLGADARADARELSHWLREVTWHESRCKSGFSGAAARADTKLAHLIGSETSHDLESAPASALASALASAPESIRSHLSCDLS